MLGQSSGWNLKQKRQLYGEFIQGNPNVWLELGYALALGRPTVILCEKAVRPKLPFDIQHRPIIFYRTDSRSGFEELEANIVKWVKHELGTERLIATAPTLRPESEGTTDLEAYEVSILSSAFAFWPTSIGSISHWELEKKLKRDRFTEVGIALGIANLLDRSFLMERMLTEESINGNYELKHYQITPEGIGWLRSHKELLTVKVELPKAGVEDVEDDIPF